MNPDSFPAPLYAETVLGPNFEDAKRYFLDALLEIHYAHSRMLAHQGILTGSEEQTLRAALNHLDLFVLGGMPGVNITPPWVLGGDATGVIDAVGDLSGVSDNKLQVGDSVIINPGISDYTCEYCLAGEHSAEDLLPSIDVPVLVIGGDKDNFTPVRYAEALARAMPKGELVMLSATHVAPLEQRQIVHAKVGEFLDRLTPE